MTSVQKRGIRAERFCILLFLLLSAAACVKTILISLDIAENYAIAVAYRLAKGETLFLGLWESHQLSGVYLAPLIWFYLKIAGTTTGIVIYTRICGTILHLLLGLFLVRTFRKELPVWGTWMLFFLHMNFLPKWVQTPEFELLQYWLILLQFLLLYRAYRTQAGEEKKERRKHALLLVLAGIMIPAQMLLYPTLFLLYPVLLAGILVCARGEQKHRGQEDVLLFTAGALAAGMAFLACIFSYLSLSGLRENLSYIMQDESHTMVSTAVKWKIYAADFRRIAMEMLAAFAVSFAVPLVIWIRRGRAAALFGKVILCGSCVLICLLGIFHAWGTLAGDQNQFYMLWRYAAIALCGILAAVYRKGDRSRSLLWFGILPGLFTVPAVLIVTNMDVNTTMAKLYISVLASVLLLFGLSERSKWEERLLQAATAFLLIGLLIGKLIQMRITGCGQITVLAPMERITQGPAKGVYMISDTAEILNRDYADLAGKLSSGDRLLYIGAENLVYLWSDAQVATPSTQGTNAYNQEFVSYYKMHPEKMPTVIVIDKQLGVNPVYYVSPQNHILLDWIAAQYQGASVTETEYLKIIRKE